MPDYSKGKIYKILNNIDNEIYVGSTIKTLSQRMANHRYVMNTKPHYKLYEHMNELGVDNFYIELIENCPCNDTYELRAREGHFIREIATLNMQIAGRTKKEWYKDNEEHIKEVHKQYYEGNKEHLKEVQKQYIEEHKERYKEYRKQYREEHKERYKQYREEHKEQQKQYYENNKEHISKHNSEKIQCNICGCQSSRIHMSRHQKSNKCKLISESKNKQNLITKTSDTVEGYITDSGSGSSYYTDDGSD